MLTHVSILTTHGRVQLLPHYLGVQKFYSKHRDCEVTHVHLDLIDPTYRYKGRSRVIPRKAHVSFRVLPDFACTGTSDVMIQREKPPHTYWFDILPAETVRAVSDWVKDNWRSFGATVVLESAEYSESDPIG